jgi:hypothetical protein
MRLRTCALLFAVLETPNGLAGTSIAIPNGGYTALEPSGLARRASFDSLPMQHLNTKLPPFIYRRLDTHPMPNGWQLELGTYASMLPTGSAAAILERFYKEVVERATFQLAESKFYRLRSGQLALEFFCRQAPIPWVLVGNFAKIMAAGARRGFTGRYEIYYTHVGQGVTVAISLYVLSDPR